MTNDFMWSNIESDPRRHFVEQAQAWTAQQAERLEVEVEEIDAAIRRGWLPPEIEQVESAADLLRRRR